MIRSTLLATAAVSLSLTATEASAHSFHRHHGYHHHHRHHASYRHRPVPYDKESLSGSNVAAARARGLPWCGAEMADEFGIHGEQGRELWVARNWAHVGTPTSAHVGAVVVWPHHVGRIVGQENGQWVVESGNDAGGVRSRPRSLAGAIAIRDVGGFGGGGAVASFQQPQYRASYRHHDQRIARVEDRTPLWMHEEAVQPDRFGAAVGSWPHYGGRIVDQENGRSVVRSDNMQSRTRSLAGTVAIRDVGGGFDGGFVGANFDQPQNRASYEHHQRITRLKHRMPLWMYEETVQPDRFSAAAES